jgi:hypothetical protein
MKTYNAQEFQVWLGQWDNEIQVDVDFGEAPTK